MDKLATWLSALALSVVGVLIVGALRYLFRHGEKHREVDIRLDGCDEKDDTLRVALEKALDKNDEAHETIKEDTGEIKVELARLVGYLERNGRKGT